MDAEVTLGGVTVPVIPQRHAYLARQIGPAIQGVIARGEGLSVDALLDFAGEGVYDLLSALIPTLPKRMPRWQFLGFASADAMAADEYDELLDESPTLPEIKTAFMVAIRVNGIDELAKLGKLIDPRLLRSQVTSAIANAYTASPSLPPTNGGSPSTSSGASDQTSTANEDSPSIASPA
jgi:hypothetical protein